MGEAKAERKKRAKRAKRAWPEWTKGKNHREDGSNESGRDKALAGYLE